MQLIIQSFIAFAPKLPPTTNIVGLLTFNFRLVTIFDGFPCNISSRIGVPKVIYLLDLLQEISEVITLLAFFAASLFATPKLLSDS